MSASYSFSNPASKNTQRSVTTGGFQAAASRGDVQQARRTGKALRGNSNQAQPMQGVVHPVGVHDGAAFVLGMTGGDPQRDLYIAATYGGEALAIGQAARGPRTWRRR